MRRTPQLRFTPSRYRSRCRRRFRCRPLWPSASHLEWVEQISPGCKPREMMGSATDFNPEGVEHPFHPEREPPCLQCLIALSARELPVRLQSRKLAGIIHASAGRKHLWTRGNAGRAFAAPKVPALRAGHPCPKQAVSARPSMTEPLHETCRAFTACLGQGWRQKLRTRIESPFSIGVHPRSSVSPIPFS